MMSPTQYYEECGRKIFNVSSSKLKAGRERDKYTLDKLKNVLLVYKKKLCVPIINYAEKQQEGLHRMYVLGELFGWDHKFPVLAVTFDDPERAEKEEEQKRLNELAYKVERAISSAKDYRYTSIEEFPEQLQWELDKVFKFDDAITKPVQFESTVDNSTVTISIFNQTYTVKESELKIEQRNDELDDIDLEDDDYEDFLDKYLPDWRDIAEDEKTKLVNKFKNEDISADADETYNILKDVLDTHNHCYYQNTAMCLDVICEDLYYNHGIDATYKGRSIYVGNVKLATIKVSKDGPDLVGMYDYIIYTPRIN